VHGLAHRDLPFNTIVEVINTTNNRTAVVKINDRGPLLTIEMLDLSFCGCQRFKIVGTGENRESRNENFVNGQNLNIPFPVFYHEV
jgi:rare lipoprotein A